MRKIIFMLLLINFSQIIYSKSLTIKINGITKFPNVKPGEKTTLFGDINEIVDNVFINQGKFEQRIILTKSTDNPHQTNDELTDLSSRRWEFILWNGHYSGNKNPEIITVSGNKPVNATFDPVQKISISNSISSIVISKKYKLSVIGHLQSGNTVDISDKVQLVKYDDKITLLENNHFTAGKSGSTKLTVKYEELAIDINLTINFFEDVTSESNSYLRTNISNPKINVPVVIINFHPTTDGVNIDGRRYLDDYFIRDTYYSYFNLGRGDCDVRKLDHPACKVGTLEMYKKRAEEIHMFTKYAIQEGSKFRGFSNKSSVETINVQVVRVFNFYELKTKIYERETPQPDHQYIHNLIGMKDLVENYGVKEIWFSIPPLDVEYPVIRNGLIPRDFLLNMPESNMSSPYGDVSNSSRMSDLPVYNKTYVVYGTNVDRGPGEAIHNRGHQIESQLHHLDLKSSLNPLKLASTGNLLFWNKFVGINTTNKPLGRAGMTHFPPNTNVDYDYCNNIKYESDIFDWNPVGGKKQLVSCSTWNDLEYKLPYQTIFFRTTIKDDAHYKWLLFWFQSIPGYQNNIQFQSEKDNQVYEISNWFDLFYNWDTTNKENKNLVMLDGKYYRDRFYLDKNGITIKCDGVPSGLKGSINGTTYESVDLELLKKRINEGADLSKVCVSNITNMSNLFRGVDFNQQINNWDVSSVTIMQQMFQGSTFNQPISIWDVSKVTDMMAMFDRSSFNQPIGNWNVSNVKNMSGMFHFGSFNQPIGNWNVSNVTDMGAMFDRSSFNQPIGNWNVSNVKNMSGMFHFGSFNQPIGNWNVINVTNMEYMFSYSAFNQPINLWCVIKINAEPQNFSTLSPLTSQNKPIWGTCPGLPIRADLVRPADNTLDLTLRPILEWNTIKDASKYHIQVYQGLDPVVVDTLISTTSVTLTKSLKSKTLHNWRVRGYNESKKLYGEWSSIFKFTTQSIQKPSLSSPANGATNLEGSVDLTWSPTLNTTSYHIQVAGVSSFSPLYFESTNVISASVKLPSFVVGNPITYYWKVRSKLDSGEVGDWSDVWSFTRAKLTSDGDSKEIPIHYSLYQNYPNPFNPSTNISFSLPSSVPVRLETLSVLGQTVSVLVDQIMVRGNHTITFDGSSLSSGVYLYRLTTPEFTQTRVMSLVK